MDTLKVAAKRQKSLALISKGKKYSFGSLLHFSRLLADSFGNQQSPPSPPSNPNPNFNGRDNGFPFGQSRPILSPRNDKLFLSCLNNFYPYEGALPLAVQKTQFPFLPTVKNSVFSSVLGHRQILPLQDNPFLSQNGNKNWPGMETAPKFQFRRRLGSLFGSEFDAINSNSFPDGNRIGIFAEPTVEFVIALWATWRAGGVAVPLATSHPEAELLHVFEDAGISMIVAPEAQRNFLSNLAATCGADFVPFPSVSTTNLDFSDGKISDDVESLMVNSDVPDEKSAALLIYTSGTTGRPKGAVHTHASVGAQARMLSDAWEYSEKDKMLNCLPLHHVHGNMNALISPLSAGSAVEFMPKFNAKEVWQKWRESYPENGEKSENPITMFTGVPTMYVRLLQAYDSMSPSEQKVSRNAASKLRLMMCGSSALPESVMERWEDVTGHRLLERYGMTELGMALTNPLHQERRAGYVGFPFRGEEVRIISDNGDDQGELRVKSPGMFREYWRRPEATRESFDSEGFFMTGDVAKVDKGYIKIVGRKSVDILKVGGYKISALDIESDILQHPRVSECAVVGVRDSTYGERIAAVVALKESEGEEPLSLEELRDWASQRMAPYKVPTILKVVDAIPRNAMGKVNKKDLVKEFFTEPEVENRVVGM